MNYTELQSEIASWVANSTMSGKEALFVTLAEGEISSDLSVRPMNIEQVVAVTAGARSVVLPANVIDPIDFRIAGQNPNIVIKSREELDRMEQGQAGYDATKVYGALIGQELRVFPALAAGNVTIYAKCAIPALSDANPSNWLLTAFPNVYLFGCMHKAGLFLRDANLIAFGEKEYQKAIAKVNEQYTYRGQMAAPTIYGAR